MHVCLVSLSLFLAAADDAKAIRYGIAPDLTAFPQKTPQETLASVIKAAEAKRFDYLTAQLADPAFVDDRVQRLYGGHFAEQVEDTRTRMDEPTLVILRRFQKDGTWKVEKESAGVSVKEYPDRGIFFRLIGARWYMEHRMK
jgi:hypothetical protein